MEILPYQTHNLTSRAGLAMLAELIAQLRLSETLDQAIPVAGSNRGYAASILFNTFMLQGRLITIAGVNTTPAT